MKKSIVTRSFIAMLALLALVCALSPAALAYDAGQYYEADESLTAVSTVEVTATPFRKGAETARDQLVKAGFDSFVYQQGDSYRVMCGKFRDASDAESYRNAIREATRFTLAEVETACLPERVIQTFESDYASGSVPSAAAGLIGTAPYELRLFDDAFAKGQHYGFDPSLPRVYTVQVAISDYLEWAEGIRDSLLAAGYDSFLVDSYGGGYNVMAGKFKTVYDAQVYSESIHGNTDMAQAYASIVFLDKSVIDAFQETFYSAVTISDKPHDMETFWEKSFGAYYRADDPNTVTVFTVQTAAGPSFTGAEWNRDTLMTLGYPSFVYKVDLDYHIMSGAYFDYAKAQAMCESIVANTDWTSAVVTTAQVPSGAVDALSNWNG